jgi:glycosyl transferase family 25
LKIYVINLDKDVQRRRWMEGQLAAQKLEYSRVAAVDGAQVRAKQDPYWSDPRRSHLGVAEIGCVLSHAHAWRLITKADGEHGLVLEDDLHLSHDFGDLVRGLSLDPKELCIHKMETNYANVTLTRQPTYTVGSRSAHKLETNHAAAGAYILNKRTASHLLDYVAIFTEPVDTELFDPRRRKIKNVTIYQWVPAPCIQDCFRWRPGYKSNIGFVSSIGMDRADRRFYSVQGSQQYKALLKSLLRPLYTTLYSALLLQSGRMRTAIEFR